MLSGPAEHNARPEPLAGRFARPAWHDAAQMSQRGRLRERVLGASPMPRPHRGAECWIQQQGPPGWPGCLVQHGAARSESGGPRRGARRPAWDTPPKPCQRRAFYARHRARPLGEGGACRRAKQPSAFRPPHFSVEKIMATLSGAYPPCCAPRPSGHPMRRIPEMVSSLQA